MIINQYKINSHFSGALIEINGEHGKIQCLGEDRIYFILEGDGLFIIDNKSHDVSPNDAIFVPKNTPYNIIGKMKYFLICSPAFDPKHDIHL
jgi:mannose-6-phosphate isomerase-like protein (cupin superfamily)